MSACPDCAEVLAVLDELTRCQGSTLARRVRDTIEHERLVHDAVVFDLEKREHSLRAQITYWAGMALLAASPEEGLKFLGRVAEKESMDTQTDHLTLWNDPHDCGLRAEVGFWACPRDAHAADRSLFPRVTRERQAALVAAFGDMVPEHPGEVSHVELDACDPALFGGEGSRPIGGCHCGACEKGRGVSLSADDT